MSIELIDLDCSKKTFSDMESEVDQLIDSMNETGVWIFLASISIKLVAHTDYLLFAEMMIALIILSKLDVFIKKRARLKNWIEHRIYFLEKKTLHEAASGQHILNKSDTRKMKSLRERMNPAVLMMSSYIYLFSVLFYVVVVIYEYHFNKH